MKTILFILFVSSLVITSLAFVQTKPPVKKIYGYKQASIPGILPKYSPENEAQPKTRTKPKQHYNYWFYLEIPIAEKIKITGLWIAGIAHDLKSDTINPTPLTMIIVSGTEKNDTIVMAPGAKNKLLLIYPAAESRDTVITSRHIKDLTTKNELVIAYTWKNKKYYTSLKKLRELSPEVRP